MQVDAFVLISGLLIEEVLNPDSCNFIAFPPCHLSMHDF